MPILAARDDNIKKAAKRLKEGDIVIIPTETVYGMAAHAGLDQAVVKIYTTKKRPRFNPLICHVKNLEQAKQIGDFSLTASALAKAFWPGPLTIIVPYNGEDRVALTTRAGLETIAIRVPAHPVVQALFNYIDFPIAAPSANPSGRISPTCPDHVQKAYKDDLFILDGGPCIYGIESTIVDCTGVDPVVLRHGAIAFEDLQAIIPTIQSKSQTDEIKAPGLLKSHYAPSIPLRLTCDHPQKNEALLAFGPNVPTGFAAVFNLSPKGDLTEAASRLFMGLHDLDQPTYAGIAVMSIPDQGLGVAINDRLQRASYDR